MLARWQIAATALLLFGIAGVVAFQVLRSPDVPFLLADDAPWIVAQTPLQTNGMELDAAQPPRSLFERRFLGAGRSDRVTLHVRALRQFELSLNGQLVPATSDPTRWKDVAVVDVTSRIVPGENVLVARVTNPEGNPALQLRIEGLAEPIVTDTRWPSAWEGDPVAFATLAEDSVRHPESALLPAPLASLRAKALPLALFAAVGALLFVVLQRLPRAAPWAPTVALALVTAFWLLLFRNVLRTPADVGFDAAAHLHYVEWFVAHRWLAPPDAGSATYHPPLFHALAALLLAGARSIGVSDHAALVMLPLAAGLGMVWVARGMARALLPDAHWIEAAAILATAFLPMNLTLASCVSNEAPYALLASVALLATLRALVRERTSLRDDVLLGALLGAAALTKYSALLWIPLLLGALGLKRLLVERTPVARATLRALLALGLVVAIAGWVYLRNADLTGNPVVTNHDATPGKSWWQLPGFHTATYFTRFGEVLVLPWFSSFYSFWDAFYSTLWGDGLLSGALSPGVAVRRWNLAWMAVVFALAVPASLLLAAGWIDALRRSLRGNAAGSRLAFSLLVVLPPILFASVLSVNLHYPFWSLGKAFYALALAPTLGLLGALGFAQLDGLLGGAPLAIRALPHAWASAFLLAVACSYAG